MTEPPTEPLRPEIPAGMEAVGALLELARAFAPNFQLPQLLSSTPNGQTPSDSDSADRIQKAEARYQTLVEQIPAVTFMASFENGLSEIYVSPHIETMLGYTAREWIDDPILWYQRLHPDDKQRWNLEFSRTVSWAEPFRADYRFLAKDGRVVWIHGEAKVVRDATGQPSFVQGIGYDITELKEAEEILKRSREELETLVTARTAELASANTSLQQAKEEADRANRSKSEFLSRMSHELRTPLNAILGFGQLMEAGLNTPDQIENIEQILSAGRHLLGLINEVLDIASIEAGRITVSLESVSVDDATTAAIDLVGPLATERNIQVTSTKSNQHIRADRHRFTQVLLNLLSNAIKYNREAGRVTIDFQEEGEGKLRIKINDTGPGISAKDMERLFSSFERLEAGKTKVEGTGLGLSVCKQLVELMGGEIGVESTVGVGSTFWVKLPIVEKSDLPPDQTEEKAHASVDRVESHTLLYIEDNLANLTLLQRILERRWKIKFLTAMDGTQGVALAREHLPDLILLDLYLPDISGEEVLSQLRQAKETAEIPVFIISADATSGHAERLLAAGAQAYLTKPLEVPQFLQAIEKALIAVSKGRKIRPVSS
jgi:PAS domain S-box-containing protein